MEAEQRSEQRWRQAAAVAAVAQAATARSVKHRLMHLEIGSLQAPAQSNSQPKHRSHLLQHVGCCPPHRRLYRKACSIPHDNAHRVQKRLQAPLWHCSGDCGLVGVSNETFK